MRRITQKERQERSREEIYQAALEEFGSHGYDKVNMERICGNHGISKGMMYHYYSSKDELFLLCVERTFQDLKAWIERDMGALERQGTPEAVQEFFMIRESFFRLHPKQRMIFESAMLRPPQHLVEQIRNLRAPIRQINQKFLEELVTRMPLRKELDPQRVTRYLESLEPIFQNIISDYQGGQPERDFHAMLKTAGELLNMVLFGILQAPPVPPPQPERASRPVVSNNQ